MQASVSSLPPASWAFVHSLNPTSTCPLYALFTPTLPPPLQEHVCNLHTHTRARAHLQIHAPPPTGHQAAKWGVK